MNCIIVGRDFNRRNQQLGLAEANSKVNPTIKSFPVFNDKITKIVLAVREQLTNQDHFG